MPTGVNCTQTLVKCRLPQGAKVEQDKHVVITQTRQTDGSWILTNTECDALVAKPRGPSGIDVLDAVRKLVPRPGVGVAPPGGVTLVNMQTLLWVDTPAARSLGTVRLLNRPVTIQVHVDRVDWRFGDGTSTATSTPGKAYTTADPCHTVTCPDYFGHVYRRTGSMQVSATVNWSGRYRVGTGPWQQIPGTATGRTSTTTLTVREARGVLVPNPSNWSDSH